MTSSVLMDKADIQRAIATLASEIAEHNGGAKDIVLIGIRTRGAPLAERIAEAIAGLGFPKPSVGTLDITLYRDDIGLSDRTPVVRKTEIPFNIFDKTIVLVDDVLYTGRTIRAALDALNDYGRPRRIQLCVLIDRGNRELPIGADFAAKKIATGYEDKILVRFRETDGEEQVLLKTADKELS
jgi:pyrimidine operon attenuation protein/uracil phosphoribosyltransferase